MTLNCYMSTFNLYDLSKKGTLVLAGPRYGSHFLAQVITNQLSAGKIGTHSELGLTEQMFYKVYEEVDNLEQCTGYQVAIINDYSAKLAIVSDPARFANWHIVKITHNNKLRWFKSYWYFLLNQGQGFGHHGTEQDVYQLHQAQTGQHTITQEQMGIITWNLCRLLINQHIACNEQIDYSELSKLETNVLWRENNYPDTSLSELFSNSDALEKLLTNWPKEL